MWFLSPFPKGVSHPTQTLLCPLSRSQPEVFPFMSPPPWFSSATRSHAARLYLPMPSEAPSHLARADLDAAPCPAPDPDISQMQNRAKERWPALTRPHSQEVWPGDSNPGPESLKPSPSHLGGSGAGATGRKAPYIKWLGSSKKAGLLGSEPQTWPPSLTSWQGTDLLSSRGSCQLHRNDTHGEASGTPHSACTPSSRRLSPAAAEALEKEGRRAG